ncbi:hypothetical protein TRAPUB_2409 [Trametes pubescens]|uniref:Myb-like domain-containing protein n=1 Tax=Trametes pubescens TaxID=154538 RepID=A0A1M2VGP2_TRAPU|nr:hypothetical protein TRAPUB_2409 [Trametes pubescens]
MPAEGDSAATGLATEDPVSSDNEPPKHIATGTKRRVAAHWSNVNDETMVSILEKNKTEGRQANSGWKPGVWTEVSHELQGGLGGVKTVKSCQDRWRTLLKEYNTVHWLVTQVSGFGWDEDLKKVTVTDNVWDDFLKKHTKVTKYRTRGFPLYDCIAALVEGKQATGEQALRIENVTSTSRPSTATPSASKGSRRQSQTTTSSQECAITWVRCLRLRPAFA